MVNKEALVTTDGWSGYPAATGDRWHLVFPSDDGDNFKKLHWFIFNLKNWIRGMHHKISSFHLQGYLDEFIYRFNRRNIVASSTVEVLQSMILTPWLPYKQAVAL